VTWLSLFVWVVALTMVLPGGGTFLPSLGNLVLVVIVGAATMIVFGITGASVWAWISFGMACLAVVLAGIGSRTLIYDEAVTLQGVNEVIKNVAALALGVGLPVLIAIVPLTLGTAITVH
jgi:hypothetical protein